MVERISVRVDSATLVVAGAAGPCVVEAREASRKFPQFDPVFRPFEHVGTRHGETASAADRAVLIEFRRLLAVILRAPNAWLLYNSEVWGVLPSDPHREALKEICDAIV